MAKPCGCANRAVSAVDWIVADILAMRQNAVGHVRYVLKDRLKWLPLYGYYFSQVTCFSAFFFDVLNLSI